MKEEIKTIANAVHAIGAVVAGETDTNAGRRQHMMPALKEIEELIKRI